MDSINLDCTSEAEMPSVSVVERYARSVVPQSPPVTAVQPMGLRRLFGSRVAA
jgi:hypothetical protein